MENLHCQRNYRDFLWQICYDLVRMNEITIVFLSIDIGTKGHINRMNIRQIKERDTEAFYKMMVALDAETEFMMYEPGEREEKTPNLERLKNTVKSTEDGDSLLLVAENNDGELVGYIWGERGTLNRVRHTAYVVIGIRKTYTHQGLGTRFFEELDKWAREHGIVRLELTVECPNEAGIALYKKAGFKIEGTRPKSMLVNGQYVDEYYMGKILEY